MGLVTYLCCSLLFSCSLLSDEFSDSSAPVCGLSHKRQSSVNFYNIGPSQRLQLFINCSCLDPFQRVQSFRSRLLQHGPHGATGPDKTLLLHGLSRGLQRVFWPIHLLWHGVFHKLQRCVPAPLCTSSGGTACRATACLNIVFTRGSRGGRGSRISALVPAAPHSPPSSLTLLPSQFFHSPIFSPFSQMLLCSGVFYSFLIMPSQSCYHHS